MVSPVYRIPFSTFPASLSAQDPMSPLAQVENCFFAGPENHLVPSVLGRVCYSNCEGSEAAPLVFWGEQGNGKSCLAHGMAKRCREDGQEVVLLRGHKLTYRGLNYYRRTTSTSALWIIDDLDLISRSESLAEGLCQLIDEAARGEGRMVATLSRPPAELIQLCPRLRGRIGGGLVVQLKHISVASKVFILEEVLDWMKIKLCKPEKNILLERLAAMDDSPRDLITRLLAQPLEREATLDETVISQILPKQRKDVTVSLLVLSQVVAKYFGITTKDLNGRSRRCGIVLARHIFMFLAHQTWNHSTQDIARFLRRDHSTVLHGCAVIRKKITVDTEIERHLSLLKSAVRS